jgi:tetraacyldisaccharide 4'-kinase
MNRFLSTCYGIGSSLHRGLYTHHLKNSYQFDTPVIGIGNVQCGGTGKSPTVRDLAKRYSAEGVSVCIVLSGYKKKGDQSISCASVSDNISIEKAVNDFGDEGAEFLITLRDHKNIWVIASRQKWKGVAWAQNALKPGVILVDDALQHFPLRCRKMLILATHPDHIAEDSLIPQGDLREKKKPTQMKSEHERWVWSQSRDAHQGKQSLYWNRSKPVIQSWASGKEISIEALSKKPIHILTAIAKPQNFVEYCRRWKLDPDETHFYPDHHPFTKKEIESLLANTSESIQWCVTVKDAVKLNSNWFLPHKLWVVQSSIEWNEYFHKDCWPWLAKGVLYP